MLLGLPARRLPAAAQHLSRVGSSKKCWHASKCCILMLVWCLRRAWPRACSIDASIRSVLSCCEAPSMPGGAPCRRRPHLEGLAGLQADLELAGAGLGVPVVRQHARGPQRANHGVQHCSSGLVQGPAAPPVFAAHRWPAACPPWRPALQQHMTEHCSRRCQPQP